MQSMQSGSDSNWSDDERSPQERKRKRKTPKSGNAKNDMVKHNEVGLGAAETTTANNDKVKDNEVGAAEATTANKNDKTKDKEVGAAAAITANKNDTVKDKKVGAAAASQSDEEDDDDGIVLDKALLQSDAVRSLDNDPEYQSIKKMTTKTRTEGKKNKRYRAMRAPIRSAAKAAREAYVVAQRSDPDTPDVRSILKVSIVMQVHQVIIVMQVHQVIIIMQVHQVYMVMHMHQVNMVMHVHQVNASGNLTMSMLDAYHHHHHRLTAGKLSLRSKQNLRKRDGSKLPPGSRCYDVSLQSRGLVRERPQLTNRANFCLLSTRTCCGTQ